MKPYDYETGTGVIRCELCDGWYERKELEVIDGIEMCPGCAEDYLELKLSEIEIIE